MTAMMSGSPGGTDSSEVLVRAGPSEPRRTHGELGPDSPSDLSSRSPRLRGSKPLGIGRRDGRREVRRESEGMCGHQDSECDIQRWRRPTAWLCQHRPGRTRRFGPRRSPSLSGVASAPCTSVSLMPPKRDHLCGVSLAGVEPLGLSRSGREDGASQVAGADGYASSRAISGVMKPAPLRRSGGRGRTSHGTGRRSLANIHRGICSADPATAGHRLPGALLDELRPPPGSLGRWARQAFEQQGEEPHRLGELLGRPPHAPSEMTSADVIVQDARFCEMSPPRSKSSCCAGSGRCRVLVTVEHAPVAVCGRDGVGPLAQARDRALAEQHDDLSAAGVAICVRRYTL